MVKYLKKVIYTHIYVYGGSGRRVGVVNINESTKLVSDPYICWRKAITGAHVPD